MGGAGSKKAPIGAGLTTAAVNEPKAPAEASKDPGRTPNGAPPESKKGQPPAIDLSKLDTLLPDDFFGINIPIEKITYGESVGKGGFGEVFKCVIENKQVAVKKLFTDEGQDMDAIYEFYHEATVMKKLKHPNIVQFLGTVAKDPDYCIITELMSGSVHDLLRLCRNQQLQMTWGLTLNIARDCAKAMAFMHGLDPPMIHRDLKSENLLINEAFTGKVADFGLARRENTEETMTVCGTPSWVAPEIIRGEQYSHSCDVYSFAILFWELVTQEKPHKGHQVSAIPMEVSMKSLRPDHPQHVPAPVYALMQDMWQVGPKNSSDDDGEENMNDAVDSDSDVDEDSEVAIKIVKHDGRVDDSKGNPGNANNRPSFAEIVARLEAFADDPGVDTSAVVDCHTEGFEGGTMMLAQKRSAANAQ